MKTNKTFVLAIAIATVLAGAPMSVFATDMDNKTNFGVVVGNEDARKLFGDTVIPTVVNDEAKGLRHLVNFVSPINKIFVVRSSTIYNQIKHSAIAAGVTTDERVAKTQVFAVEDALAAVGLHMSAESYATARGIKVGKSTGTLITEAELLGAVYEDLKNRISTGELEFKVAGIVPSPSSYGSLLTQA